MSVLRITIAFDYSLYTQNNYSELLNPISIIYLSGLSFLPFYGPTTGLSAILAMFFGRYCMAKWPQKRVVLGNLFFRFFLPEGNF